MVILKSKILNINMQSREDIPYTLCATHNYFYMQCLTTSRHFSTVLSGSSKQQINNACNNYLKVNRRTNKINEISKEEYQGRVQEIAFTHIVKFYNLIGTVIVNHQPYLLIATNISQVARYIQYPVYLINDVQFLPYRTKLFQKAEQTEQQSKIIQQLKKNHINKHFYYSYKENITSSLIEQQINKQKIELFNEFAWNAYALQNFRSCKINQCWKIPIIQGFVAQVISQNKYFTFEYLSLNRRSIHMSGTRFNSRGLDEQAHSSNFVQTEEIFKCHNNLYVHISVRGSVPLFWKQIRVRSDIHYMKDKDIDEETIIKQHYQQLQAKYNASITTINLLSKQKSPQKQLKYRFEALFNRNIKSPYLFFDLNQQIKDKTNGQINVTKFVENNQKYIFGQYPFLMMKNITRQIKYHQTMYKQAYQSIPRINCLDCLDRTNVMMARISEHFLRSVEKLIRLIGEHVRKKDYLDECFMKQHIKVWTTLGNCISEIYCGTASVASHMTKKENNSIKTFLGGAIISLNRYINATTTDVFKQQCIDCLLGRRGILSKTDYFNSNITLQKLKSVEYCKYTPIRIILVTFNTNNINIFQQGQQASQEFLSDLNGKDCSMVVFHLQEVINSQKWIQNLQLLLSKRSFSLLIHYKYEKSNLLSLIFIKNEMPKKFDYKFIQVIQIPLKSYGALAFFIEINNTITCFINCRLQSGYQNKSLRLDDFNQVHKFLLSQTYRNNLFKLCENIFCAGDLNLRLSYGIQKEFKFKNLMEQFWANPLKNDPNELIREGLIIDQFPLLKKSKLIEYCEADITFLPTYKINSKKAVYDKLKYPAWCDRILFCSGLRSQFRLKQETSISCKEYIRIEENYGSTHKGVMGLFQFFVKEQNTKIKSQLISKYLYE